MRSAMDYEPWVEPAIEAGPRSGYDLKTRFTATYRLVSLQPSLNHVKNLGKEV
jgi:hypothetical protein